MKRILLTCTLGLMLAGCAGTVTPQQATTKVDEIKAKVEQARTVATQLCGFLPTVNTVLNIFSSSSGLANASVVAQAVCDAVTNRPAADGPGRKAKVAGVTVHGKFVR